MLEKVERRTLEMQQKARPRTQEAGWLSRILSPGKEERKGAATDGELRKLCTMLKIDMDSDAKSSECTPARADEYYWIVGDFSLKKVVFKIQRGGAKGNTEFKEAIAVTLEGITSRFMKRFKGMDLHAGIRNIVLTTYSTFGESAKIKNVILSQNPLAANKHEDLAFVRIRMLPPNLSVQFDIEARAKSLRIYYLPFLISRLLSFLGKQEVRAKTYTKLNEIKGDTQDTIQAAFEGKKYNVLVTVESPIVLIPILKNDDPSSPIWCFKLGDIELTSKVGAEQA